MTCEKSMSALTLARTLSRPTTGSSSASTRLRWPASTSRRYCSCCESSPCARFVVAGGGEQRAGAVDHAHGAGAEFGHAARDHAHDAGDLAAVQRARRRAASAPPRPRASAVRGRSRSVCGSARCTRAALHRLQRLDRGRQLALDGALHLHAFLALGLAEAVLVQQFVAGAAGAGAPLGRPAAASFMRSSCTRAAGTSRVPPPSAKR